MDHNRLPDLDVLIEQALSEEPIRPVPMGFHARLEERLRIAALVEREKKRFRYGTTVGAVLFAALGLTFVFVPVLAYLQGWVVRSVPGGMGYLDYVLVSLVNVFGTLHKPSGVAVVAAAGFIVLAALVSLWRLRPAKIH